MIPSIDLMDGKAVQLRGGKEKILEKEDFLELARQFNRYGEIAVIDLDAAMGKGDNLEEIKQILKMADCRVGGGVRSIEKAKELISLGAVKVIVGSKAFEGDKINHEFLRELSENGKNRVIIALDALRGEVVTQGWTHRTGLNLFDVVKGLEKYCSEFLFTCVEREGSLEGIDMSMVKKLGGTTGNLITVAGGVNSIEQIREISELGMDVQLGMGIYTGKIDLSEAFIESLSWGKGLIPTITQDQSGQVLTLAYSSKESLKKTFETGKVWYYSRSRQKLWMKGETSKNFQEFLKVRIDCDRDALLVTAKQKGVACHTGSYSCFGDKRFSLYELYDVVKDRLKNPAPGSYTAKLTDKILREKILEEAGEVVEAKSKEEVIWEAADLLYFLTVLLAKEGVTIGEALFELRRRRRG